MNNDIPSSQLLANNEYITEQIGSIKIEITEIRMNNDTDIEEKYNMIFN